MMSSGEEITTEEYEDSAHDTSLIESLVEDEIEISAESTSSFTTSTAKETQNICRVPVTKAINFQEYINEKHENTFTTDAEIRIGNDVIKCQRSILKLYSRYVRQLKPFRKNFVLPPEKVTADAMQCISEWMRSRHYKLRRDTILEVHAAAKFLEIDSLIAQTWNCITSSIIVEDRAFMLYLEAIFFELPTVQSLMIARVRKFFLTLVGYMQFAELPFVHVCEMLESDHLGVNCELEVFYACVRYLSSHWEDRKDRAFEMLKHVRFGLLPPHILVSFRFKKESPEINRMLENSRVEKLLSQTMHFSIGLGTPPAASVLFKEREWIYDMECEYHSTRNYPGKKRLTYERFLKYVRYLAKAETHWMQYENAQDVESAIELMEKGEL